MELCTAASNRGTRLQKCYLYCNGRLTNHVRRQLVILLQRRRLNTLSEFQKQTNGTSCKWYMSARLLKLIILCGHCFIEQLHSMCNSTMQRVYLRPWSNYTYHTNSSSQNELQRRAGVQCNFLRKQRREQEKRFRTRFGHRDDVLPTVPTLY